MAAEEILTWDNPVAAHRPTLDELGGAELKDEEDSPPVDDGSELYALKCNQETMQIHAMSRVCFLLVLTIDFSGGAPFIAYFQPCGTAIVHGDVSLIDNGTGDTTIRWTTTKLPPVGCDPLVSVNADGDTTITVVRGTIGATTEFRVRTRTGGGLANVRFTIGVL